MPDPLDKLKTQLSDELKKDPLDFQEIARLNKLILEADTTRVRFAVDARHIHRLGFELVGRQETALSELIKNAYDADATEVRIDFHDFEAPGGTLTVSDNGLGMTEEVVRSAWMRLSTHDKELSPISPKFGRSRAGRKGIGRFAVERLGKALTLETCVKNEPEGIRVQFNWDEMFQPEVDIDLLAFAIERFVKPLDAQGTKLIVSQLRDRWTPAQLERVWKSVILLQPPFKVQRTYRGKSATATAAERDPGFSVAINGVSSNQRKAEFSIDKTFLEQRLAHISGRIDKDGNAHIDLVSKRLDLKDKVTLDKRYLTAGETSFNADYFIYAPEFIKGFSMKTVAEVSERHGGIRIYRDGFRVLPYGEERDDWLKLAYDVGRRVLLIPANNQNFFGQVELSSDENPFLEETSSREGLIENEAFAELTDFVRTGLEWAVTRIAAHRERKQRASQPGFESKVRKKPSEVLREIIDTSVVVGRDESAPAGARVTALTEKLEEAQESAKEYEDEIERREEAHLRYEEMLRILASLGTSIAVFSHEVRGALNGLTGHLMDLQTKLDHLGIHAEALLQMDNARGSMGRLHDLASYVMSLIAHTASREKHEVALHAALHGFAKQFTQYLNKRHIQFEIDVSPPYLRTAPIHQSEIDSVLFNFLTNSIKAMDRANTADRQVKITADRVGRFARISFQDTGTGVPADIADKIFDAFFTTQQFGQDEIAGPGAGLGLKIVSDIATANGGEVKLGTPTPGFKCRFDLLLPVSEGQR